MPVKLKHSVFLLATAFFTSSTQPSVYSEEHVHLLGDGTFAIVNESLRKAAQWACGIGVTIVSSGIGAAAICQSLWSRIAHQESSTPEVEVEPKGSSPTSTQEQDTSQGESSAQSRSASQTISNSLRVFLKNRGDDISDGETDASAS
ncbi:hypothetical protein FOL47_003705 [Perkinsus chesapeaki]|uniref:Uncharacterized protein n=1 Tax=Perkinsus chesapeaki TaxID=330153 RepID=A0A7J6M7Y5_PERCH|nr:hypothetical protein FOL47_003705 [Perkinsus chesapeaki]